MKRILAALLAVALLTCAAGLAFEGSNYPSWDGVAVPDNSLCGSFGEDRISLSFDPSPEYSNVEDGIIQACFFAYDESESHYLELYLLLPQNAVSGDTFSNGEGAGCSILLYETSVNSDTLYYAGDAGDRTSDAGSYALTLESVESDGATIRMRGQFSARLCRDGQGQPSRDVVNIDEAHFGFALPLAAAADASPAPTQEPDSAFSAPTQEPGFTFPAPTPEPAFTFPAPPQEPGATFSAPGDAPSRRPGSPAFTLPPDYASL